MQELSQYNFKIEYWPGKEGGKRDALTRGEGDLPTAGDKRLTRNMGILLPKERYWNIPDTEEIKLDMLETTKFQDKNEGEIQKASNDDAEIQGVKRNLDEGRKEIKGVALGLCQWKDGLLWYQGKIWIPKDERIRTTLIAKHHEPPQAGHGGTAKTTELHQPRILLAKDKGRHQTIHKKLRHMSKDQSGPTCTLRIAAVKPSPRSTMEINRYGLHYGPTEIRRI